MYVDEPALPTSPTGTQADTFRITGIDNESGRSYWTPTKNALHVFVFLKVGKFM
jgi:hypothetical protein